MDSMQQIDEPQRFKKNPIGTISMPRSKQRQNKKEEEVTIENFNHNNNDLQVELKNDEHQININVRVKSKKKRSKKRQQLKPRYNSRSNLQMKSIGVEANFNDDHRPGKYQSVPY